ncbi:hypothetical protein [Thalassorhabdomicrobium marinisediminis]|uniref:Uncharacterized protein n=1 Tax=Thalassorhabdomicrobium marinisediminis TaxID=2170577 RepID=A0A2T7FTH2_9RHOB|nr:hypothetical protein [Thalassorhabdomicrobium marinisediminis]PVA05469.1 hypothetical protein DC363_14580 [Thalassorhabdomicrobium marinisediminis]
MKTTLTAGLLAGVVASFAAQTSAQDMSAQQAIEALNLGALAELYESGAAGPDTSPAEALLIDMGALTSEDLGDSEAASAKLDRFVADLQDRSESYIGNVSDRNIVERVLKAWDEATVIEDEAVLGLLNGLVDQGFMTGYNVLDTADLSNFDPELMLRYGHSSIDHAVQLLYLMKREGFDPKVQFTPKSSAFVFLPEWGEPPASVVTFDSGTMVNVMVEYNLDFEFSSVERKQAFMDLINDYAKRDDEDEAGLIIDAWWQPFYRSYVPMDRYEPLSENRVQIGGYQADIVTLPADAAPMVEKIATVDGVGEVSTTEIWVNPAFYRYMVGDFK